MATEYLLSRYKGYAAYPAFALGQPRFPQDSFTGRYLHFKDIIDWKTLFATKVGDFMLLKAGSGYSALVLSFRS